MLTQRTSKCASGDTATDNDNIVGLSLGSVWGGVSGQATGSGQSGH